MLMLTQSDRLSEKLSLSRDVPVGGQQINLIKVGPSSQGWVYRTEDNSVCYRLLPILPQHQAGGQARRRSEDAPIERRSEVTRWIADERQGEAALPPTWTQNPLAFNLAPIIEAYHYEINGAVFFIVHYDIHFKHTLTEVLANPDSLVRLEHVIKVIRQMPIWWNTLYEGLLPMSADIVFTENEEPYLLAMPFWRFPDVDSIFAAPERGFYLAPEYVRGHREHARGNHMDRYALGMMLVQCFYNMPRIYDPATLLLRIANGSVWKNLQNNMPLWMQQLSATSKAITAMKQLIDIDTRIRSAVELLALAEQLKDYRHCMEPTIALDELFNSGHLQEAYDMIHDILIYDDSYDVLIRAGEISWRNGHPLEAIDFFEKAIKKTQNQLEAYKRQFAVIVSEGTRSNINFLIKSNKEAGSRIDETARRDFSRMTETEQDDNELAMSLYMLWREKYSDAEEFIYSRLFDEDETFLWWKWELRLRHVEALKGQGRNHFAKARKTLDHIELDMQSVHNIRPLSHSELHNYGEKITELRREII